MKKKTTLGLSSFLDFKIEDKGLWSCITNSGKGTELRYRELNT